MKGYKNYSFKYENKFHRDLLRRGKLIGGIGKKCDNGNVEMLHIEYVNGVDFIVWVVNGVVEKVG